MFTFSFYLFILVVLTEEEVQQQEDESQQAATFDADALIGTALDKLHSVQVNRIIDEAVNTQQLLSPDLPKMPRKPLIKLDSNLTPLYATAPKGVLSEKEFIVLMRDLVDTPEEKLKGRPEIIRNYIILPVDDKDRQVRNLLS